MYKIYNQSIYSAVLVTNDQYLGFTHFSKDIFGEIVDPNDTECNKLVVNNERIYHLHDGYDESFIEEINIPSNVRIWVVGIELEGTNGRFRLAEDYLIKKDYRKIAEHKFDVGIYAVEYKK